MKAFTYPTPLVLARKRAAAEGSRRAWGRVGGMTTLERHGAQHYRRIATKRWGR